jgi:hypothetical protein
MQMQMQMQMQRPVVGENTESERIQYIELDRIWGKKVILICGVVLLVGLLAMTMPANYYAPIYAIYPTLVRIYEYMVMCKIVSFVTTIISMAIFTIIVILIVLLASILFLAFIFAFTSV